MSPSDVTLERTLPNSIESERAVLGAIILDRKAIFPATEVLTVDDFYLEGHREIFRAMLTLAEDETSIDLITLREELRRRGGIRRFPDRWVAPRSQRRSLRENSQGEGHRKAANPALKRTDVPVL